VSPPVADDREQDRRRALQHLAVDLGRRDFEVRHPDLKLTPVVALICAFEEEANIGAVLAAVPPTVCDLEVTPLVIVDGGEDATADRALAAGAVTFVLPVNLGHGRALRVGYELCQNDPTEMPTLLQPLVDESADFVVASRRLGVDRTADRYRQAGVRFFAFVMNRLNGTHLTDTSNGFRALRSSMLADVVPRLVQDQYQTAELLTTAVRRGWRVTECPTVWHERRSGTSKKGANWRYGFRYANVLLSTWRRER
jgi:glycosyltransferase involved in cell wall biosynthesis